MLISPIWASLTVKTVSVCVFESWIFISQTEHDPNRLFIGIIKLRWITIPYMHPVSTNTPRNASSPPHSSVTTGKKESRC